MRDVLFVVRFLRTVNPLPPLMAHAFVAVGAAAAGLVAVDADRARLALTPLLLLQLFAASSGFMLPARRGHYDLLWTTRCNRVVVGAVHWMMSVLPGLGAWLVVAAAEILATAGSRMVLVTSGTVAAMVLVSTIPWSATVALPRFTAAIAWLVVLALVVVVAPGIAPTLAIGNERNGSWSLETALVFVVYPPALVGGDIISLRGLLVLPALMMAIGSIVYALALISRRDIPLEAAQ